ncbi:CYTH domain-containing protein [Sporolactobacillus sp. THM7-7]|nr:CYTH domain-containing protein [Sporolactobacillus sp. THM7-7]
MNQEWEIEFKNRLTEQEFAFLCRKFSVQPAAFFQQVNDYFDTPDYELRRHQSALRIRHKGGRHDLTLKQPRGHAILETHQWLTDRENRELIQFGRLPAGAVKQVIADSDVKTGRLVRLGELTTRRAQFPYENGELFLDHSLYLGKEDYELEFETPDRSTGLSVFRQLLAECSIPNRPSQNKILRLYHALQKHRS